MRIGIIDNLGNVEPLANQQFEGVSAAQLMSAVGGNTGNVAFVQGAHKIIAEPMTRIFLGQDMASVRERVDHVVICCANQVGKHVDLIDWAHYFEKLELPVTLLGLGAQSESRDVMPVVPEGTLQFLRVVSRSRRNGGVNIAVRGQFTHDVLSSHGIESAVLGCPSLFLSPVRNLGAEILKKQAARQGERIAVAAGNPWHGPSALLERTLVEIVDNYQGRYVLQHPIEMVYFAFGERGAIDQKTLNRFQEVYGDRFTFESLLSWYKSYAQIFADVPSWMKWLEGFDAVVGPRYHGIALAIQAGVPGCVVTMDGRTQELCETTGIKSIDLEPALKMPAEQLVAQGWWSDDDATKFDGNRLARGRLMVQFLASNGIEPSQHLQALVAQ